MTTLQMHSDFRSWYSRFQIGSDGARAGARWEAVASFAQDATSDDAEELLAFVYGLPKIKADLAIVDALIAKIKEHDEDFVGHGADSELRLLAACTLIAMMDREDNINSWTALAIGTSSFADQRKPKGLPFDLHAVAREKLDQLSYAAAVRPNFPESKVSPAKPIAAPETFDVATVTKLINAALGQAANMTAALAASHNQAVGAYDKYLRIQDEELQILWWIIGQRCQTLDMPFEKMKLEEQPLILSSELSQMVHNLPGPPSLKAILSRVGLKASKKLTIAAAVNSCPESWLENNTITGRSPLVFPLHFAIARKAEVDGGEWVAPYKSITGVDADSPMSSSTVAYQFLCEDMLLRAEG